MVDEASGTGGEEIRLTIPAQADFARIARLTVTGLASRLDLPYDDVEDLRIAVGEICSVLLKPAVGRLELVCRLEPRHLEIEARLDPVIGLDPVSELTRQILTAVVDEFEIDETAAWIRVRKRRGR